MKYWIPVLLLLASCKTGHQTSGDTLSIIVFTDTVIAYNGALTSQTHIDSIAINEKNIKELVAAGIKSKGEELIVLVKPAWYANAGGNARDILTWCKQAGLRKFSMSSIDTKEETLFKITGPKAFDDGVTESLKLYLPAEEADSAAAKVTAKTYTALLLKNNMVYIYGGADISNKIFYGRLYDSLFRSVLIDGRKKFGKEYFVILKPAEGATYKNSVDILDEMLINEIKKYAIVSISSDEIAFAETLQPSL